MTHVPEDGVQVTNPAPISALADVLGQPNQPRAFTVEGFAAFEAHRERFAVSLGLRSIEATNSRTGSEVDRDDVRAAYDSLQAEWGRSASGLEIWSVLFNVGLAALSIFVTILVGRGFVPASAVRHPAYWDVAETASCVISFAAFLALAIRAGRSRRARRNS
jgi:hypothetical protein